MKISVAELRDILNDMLVKLDEYGDDEYVKTVTSTYFIDSDYFIAVGSEGYVDMENILIAENNDDED